MIGADRLAVFVTVVTVLIAVPGPSVLFVVGVSNPEGLLIFGAVLPQFVDPHGGNAQVQLLLLGLVRVMIALVSDATWGLLAGTARDWLARSPRRLSWIGGASGAVMVGLGIRPALSGRE